MFKIALIYSIKTSLHSHNCNLFTPYQDNRTITATLIYKSSPPDTRVYKVTSSSFFAFLFRFFLCFSWLLFAVVVRYPTHLFFKWERYYKIYTHSIEYHWNFFILLASPVPYQCVYDPIDKNTKQFIP